MEQTKSLTAPIPASLHARVTAERIAANQSLGEYMTELLTNYYNGGKNHMAKTRPLAFQIEEELCRPHRTETDPAGFRDRADRGRPETSGGSCRGRRPLRRDRRERGRR